MKPSRSWRKPSWMRRRISKEVLTSKADPTELGVNVDTTTVNTAIKRTTHCMLYPHRKN